jgi:hypothetical protein
MSMTLILLILYVVVCVMLYFNHVARKNSQKK